jgi:hypothetical protein
MTAWGISVRPRVCSWQHCRCRRFIKIYVDTSIIPSTEMQYCIRFFVCGGWGGGVGCGNVNEVIELTALSPNS